MSLVHHHFRSAGVDKVTNLAAEELAVEDFSTQRVCRALLPDEDVLRSEHDIFAGSSLRKAQNISGLRDKARLITVCLDVTLKNIRSAKKVCDKEIGWLIIKFLRGTNLPDHTTV